MKWTVGSIPQIIQAKIPLLLQIIWIFQTIYFLSLKFLATADLDLFQALFQSSIWRKIRKKKFKTKKFNDKEYPPTLTHVFCSLQRKSISVFNFTVLSACNSRLIVADSTWEWKNCERHLWLKKIVSRFTKAIQSINIACPKVRESSHVSKIPNRRQTKSENAECNGKHVIDTLGLKKEKRTVSQNDQNVL